MRYPITPSHSDWLEKSAAVQQHEQHPSRAKMYLCTYFLIDFLLALNFFSILWRKTRSISFDTQGVPLTRELMNLMRKIFGHFLACQLILITGTAPITHCPPILAPRTVPHCIYVLTYIFIQINALDSQWSLRSRGPLRSFVASFVNLVY